MIPQISKEEPPERSAYLIKQEINAFVARSPYNRMPNNIIDNIFDEPLVHFADGDDPLFTEYKTIIDPGHLTPREVIGRMDNQNPKDLPEHLSVISWILPISGKTRKSNRRNRKKASILWTYTRWYGQKFNAILRDHLVNLLTESGYLAVAPTAQPYYHNITDRARRSLSSNWSERHIAYAAGLGTFSLSDGLITERGIAHRCSSVITSLVLPPDARTAAHPYANCLFYVNQSCRACIERCPAGAISEEGHDKERCHDYVLSNRCNLSEEFHQVYSGCGLCQTMVPCEFSNPLTNIKR